MLIGADCKLYRNTGTWASPTWNEIQRARDVTINLERAEADMSSRVTEWKLTKGALKDLTIEFDLVYHQDDPDYVVLRDAFLNNTTVEMTALDGSSATNGSEGPRAHMTVLQFGRPEPLEDTVRIPITVKPANAANAPEWYIVGS